MAQNTNENSENTMTQEELSELLKVRREKLDKLQSEGKDPFKIVKYPVDTHSTDILNDFEGYEGKTVVVGGRLMAKRVMGKASFCNVQDRNGKIQVYVSKNDIGEESYADFKKYDIGDILGIKGFVFKTKMGEISIHASEVVLLSKSLQKNFMVLKTKKQDTAKDMLML